MLESTRELVGRQLSGRGDDLGHIIDLLFSDRDWAVKYLVLDSEGRLDRPAALIEPGPTAIESVPGADALRANQLTLDDVARCPELGQILPLGKVREAGLSQHAQMRPRWSPEIDDLNPEAVAPADREAVARAQQRVAPLDLRSFTEVRGYQLWLDGEEAGRIDDLVCDTERWVVRHAVVSLRPLVVRRKQALLPVDDITRIDWLEQRVEAGGNAERLAQLQQ